jgi:hypothetical protein
MTCGALKAKDSKREWSSEALFTLTRRWVPTRLAGGKFGWDTYNEEQW